MFDALDREIVNAGQEIFRAGDSGDCAYLIEKGSVEIVGIVQGREFRLNLLGAGEMFGEMALIDHGPRTATVRAVKDSVLVPISRKLVEGLLEKSDPILHHLLLVILERFRSEKRLAGKPVGDTAISEELTSRRTTLKGEATQKLELAHDFTHALTHDEFELFYQPICKLGDGSVAGFEALLRWHHPGDGLTLPLDFLWLAEQTGLIRELGQWTLERACRDWSTLRTCCNSATPFVGVNLSADQLASESLVEDIKKTMVRSRMEPSELKLELTETVMVRYPALAQQILRELTQLGCGLALDDFGTGYSGLDHLQRFPFGTLKIDRAFTAHMLDSAQSMEIVRSSISLAHSLGINVVAEGVETEAERDKLLELECEYGQGWYYGKPVALQDLVQRYAARRPVSKRLS